MRFIGLAGRCTERHFIEFHHVSPYAVGGEPTAHNIELRCGAHNVYDAETYFRRPVAAPGPRGGAVLDDERPDKLRRTVRRSETAPSPGPRSRRPEPISRRCRLRSAYDPCREMRLQLGPDRVARRANGGASAGSAAPVRVRIRTQVRVNNRLQSYTRRARPRNTMSNRPNILMFHVDNVSVGDFGCYGGAYPLGAKPPRRSIRP